MWLLVTLVVMLLLIAPGNPFAWVAAAGMITLSVDVLWFETKQRKGSKNNA